MASCFSFFNCTYSWAFLYDWLLLLYLLLREGERARGERRDNPKQALCPEQSRMGCLHPTTLRSRPQGKSRIPCLMDWAAQVPLEEAIFIYISVPEVCLSFSVFFLLFKETLLIFGSIMPFKMKEVHLFVYHPWQILLCFDTLFCL